MGNEIMKKYDLTEQETARGGVGSFWKIYSGQTTIKNEKKDVSVWILTKDFLPDYEPKVMDQLFRLMKKDLSIMKELHSNNDYLEVFEVIEDGRMDIAFVSERIICSLSNVLTKFSNFSDGDELYSHYLEFYGSLTEPEITRGFFNLATSLHHFHTMAKRFHLNITPESIVLLPNGQWKLTGFGLSLSLQNGEKAVLIPYFLPTRATTTTSICLEPDESYLCPEISTFSSHSSSVQYATAESDVFSLGLVFYETYNYLLFSMKRGLTYRPLLCSSSSTNTSNHRDITTPVTKLALLGTIRQNIANLPVSPSIQGLLQLMLEPDPSARISLSNVINYSHFLSSPLSLYFRIDHLSSLISTVSYQLESKSSKSAADISSLSIFTSLPAVVSQLRPFILYHHLLPIITKYTLQHLFLWEYSFPILIAISSHLTTSQFLEQTSQLFITGFSTSNSDLILLLLQNMNFFLQLFSKSYFNQYIVMLFYNAINFHSLASLQSTAISIISDEKILESIELTYFKKTLIPLVCHVICQQPDLTVKLHGIIFLKFILPTLDENYIRTYLLPTLQYLISSSSAPLASPPTPTIPTAAVAPPSSSVKLDPVLLTIVLGVYKQISEMVTIEVICKDILIVLLPLLMERSLSYDHYQYLVQQITFYQSLIYKSREQDYFPPKETETQPTSASLPTVSITDQQLSSCPSSPSSLTTTLTTSRQPYRDHIPLVNPSSSVPPPVIKVETSVNPSTNHNLSSLREEIERTQNEILKLQQDLTASSSSSSPSPLPSIPIPLSQYPQPYPQNLPYSQGYDPNPSAYNSVPYWNTTTPTNSMNGSDLSQAPMSPFPPSYHPMGGSHQQVPYPNHPQYLPPSSQLQYPPSDLFHSSQSLNPFNS